MDGARFDRLSRFVATGISRRTLAMAVAALALGRFQRVSGNQLTPSTCGASGKVCTMLIGCCDGLTCVTSAINTNYGVCVAGEGGTISTGTTLISPFSENVEQEVAAIASDATATDTTTTTSTTTTTAESEQEARIAAAKARKSARRDDQQLRRSTQQTEQQTRRDDRRDARELRRGPRLAIELTRSTGDGVPETIRVTNRDDTSVFLMTVESLLNRRQDSGIEKSLAINDTLFLLSGLSIETPTDEDEFLWSDLEICPSDAEEGEGFLITAGFSSVGESHEYTILCDESAVGGGNGKPRRNKRGRGRSGGKNKNRNNNRSGR